MSNMADHTKSTASTPMVLNQHSGFPEYGRIDSFMLEAPHRTPGNSSKSLSEESPHARASAEAQKSSDQVNQLVHTPESAQLESEATGADLSLKQSVSVVGNGTPSQRPRLKLYTNKTRPASFKPQNLDNPHPLAPSEILEAKGPSRKSKINLRTNLKRPAPLSAIPHVEDQSLESDMYGTVEEPPPKRKHIIKIPKSPNTSKVTVHKSRTTGPTTPDSPCYESASLDMEVAVAVASLPEMPYTPYRTVSVVSSKTTSDTELSSSSAEKPETCAREGAKRSTASQRLTPSPSKEPEDAQRVVKNPMSGVVKGSATSGRKFASGFENGETPAKTTYTKTQQPKGQQSVPQPAEQALEKPSRPSRKRIATEKAKLAYGSPQAVTQGAQSDALVQDIDRNVPLTKEEKKKQQEQRKMDMYTPSLDPFVEPEDDEHTPHEVASMDYVNMSIKYFERRLGKDFSRNLGTSATRPQTSMRDLQVTHEAAEGEESFADKERRWEKQARQAQSRAKGLKSFPPPPKNITQLKTWLGRHGEPLQKGGYVTEHLKMTKEVAEAKRTRVVHPGATRFDTPQNRIRSLMEYLRDEESSDHEDQDGGEGFQQRRSTQSQPLSDDDKIDAPRADSANEDTPAVPIGDLSEAYVPSVRSYFSGQVEKDSEEQATIALMQLSSANIETSGC